MKKITIKKLNLIQPPTGEYEDIMSFQQIEFYINFYGHEEVFILDTKIMRDGRQLVIDGNGWIPSGYEINNTLMCA